MTNLGELSNAVADAEAGDQSVSHEQPEAVVPAQALNVCLVGANKRVRAMIENVFERVGSEWFSITDPADAVAVIANIDDNETETALKAHSEAYPAHHVLTLAFGNHETPAGAIVLQKPVLLPRLIAALDWLRKKAQLPPRGVSVVDAPGDITRNLTIEELSSGDDERTIEMPMVKSRPPTAEPGSAGPVSSTITDEPTLELARGSAPVASGATHAEHADAATATELEPTRTLVDLTAGLETGHTPPPISVDEVERLAIEGSLLEAARQAYEMSEQQQVPVEVRSNDARLLVFEPESRTAFTTVPRNQLVELCMHEHGRGAFSARPLQPGTVVADQASDAQRPEYFLFLLGLSTFDGKLPEGTDIDHPVFLRYWPNFTRLPEMPNAMRIAALWRMQATSLSRTASELNIPFRHVIDFYSACWTLGLSDHSRRSVDLILEPEELPANARRGLFEKVVEFIDVAAPEQGGEEQ